MASPRANSEIVEFRGRLASVREGDGGYAEVVRYLCDKDQMSKGSSMLSRKAYLCSSDARWERPPKEEAMVLNSTCFSSGCAASVEGSR